MRLTDYLNRVDTGVAQKFEAKLHSASGSWVPWGSPLAAACLPDSTGVSVDHVAFSCETPLVLNLCRTFMNLA